MLTNGSELIVSARVEKITLVKGEDGFNTGYGLHSSAY